MNPNPFKDYNDFIQWAVLRMANSVIRNGFQDLDEVFKHVIFVYNQHFVGEEKRPVANEKRNPM